MIDAILPRGRGPRVARRVEELDHEREKRDAALLKQRGPSARADRALLGGTASGRSRRGERAGGAAPGEIQRLLDDGDTRAFLAAEQVLRPEQRKRARAFAERYREDRFRRPRSGEASAGSTCPLTLF